MGKRSRITEKDTQQLARDVLDAIVPDAEPKKPAPNKAKPPRPTKTQDVKDIERADSEGMAQPQGLEVTAKNPAAVALGRLGGLKGGPARAKLSKKKLSAIGRKGAQARWSKRNNKKDRG